MNKNHNYLPVKANSAHKASGERLHSRFVETVRKMSVEERFDSLVRTGIVTQNGKLTREYGG